MQGGGMIGHLNERGTGTRVRYRGGRGPKQLGPPALFPAPPYSTAWALGRGAFCGIPCPYPAQAPAAPIPQTGPR